MLERNRTFGRVSRPVDKASAPRQALERQRKAGRARNSALIQPKPQGTRETPRDVVTIPPALLVDVEALQNAIAADPLPVEAPAEPSPSSLVVALEPSVEAPAVVIADDAAAALAAPPLSVAMDPASRPTAPTPRRAPRRRVAVRLAVAASVAVACLIAFARYSDAHLSAPAILSLAAPVSGDTAPVGVALPRVAALTLAPVDGAILPPVLVTAAYGTDDLVETATLPPSAREQVTARAATAPEKPEPQAAPPVQAGPAAASRKPVAKQAAARPAAPRARAEVSRHESSRGPILDFLSNLIP